MVIDEFETNVALHSKGASAMQSGDLSDEFLADRAIGWQTIGHRYDITATHPNTVDLQRWLFNNDGSITNVACPDLAISSNKEKDASMNSMYFALQNPRTQMAIGIEPALDGCTNGMKVKMQTMEYGREWQQFVYVEGESKIVSIMCPDHAIVIPEGNCASDVQLELSNNDSFNDKRDRWIFDESGSIKSELCVEKYITINGAHGGRARTVEILPMMDEFVSSLPNSPENDNETISNNVTYTNRTNTAIEWQSAIPPSVGSTLMLSKKDVERYQIWGQEYQVRVLCLHPTS